MTGTQTGLGSDTGTEIEIGTDIGLDPATFGPVHLIGIGGAGMSGIARILLGRGIAVQGSDARESPMLDGLRALGATIFVGHQAGHLAAARTVVISTAVRESNPELAAARTAGVRVLHRSEALAALMQGRRAVAIAGTHGKTTTTGMVTVALVGCGLDPSFAIGGELTEGGANARDGSGDVFVAEADESDGSFLRYHPLVAIVTNVEADHLDHYGTAAAVAAAFEQFADTIQPAGLLIACADDPGAAALAARVRGRPDGVEVITYGRQPDADVRLSDVDPTPAGIRFTVTDSGGVRYGPVTLRVPGAHNALNATAAWLAARRLGADPAAALAALAGFGGTRRRFEARGEVAGVRVVDDYAHHPTEVAAILTAARAVAGKGRLIAVFQPHLYSRTRLFAAEFGRALGLADEVVVMDVYAAREDPEAGVSGQLIADAVPLPWSQVAYQPAWSQVPAEVARQARPGDLVLTLGAGDVTLLGPLILAAIGERAG